MSQQLQITGGAKVRSLEGVITGSTGVLGSLPINASNGIPQLDVNGKILVSQLPNSVMEYKGTWNAATNTPTLADGTGNQGDVYLCNVAGTVNFGSGPISFVVGDQVIYSGTIWQKASGATGTVTSVAVTESGDALTITGSPITTSGTINIGFAGTSAQYVAGDGSLITFPTVVTQAQNLVTEVYNQTGATLTKGTVVYINGGHGNLPTITKAIATSDSTSAQTYGVVRTNITNNNNGYVTVIGNLDNLDTQAYAAGTQLYLSSTTAGAWTSTKQYAPNHLVYVGIVVRSHPTQGVVEIRIQNGFELDELHDVSAQTPSNNQGIFYNSSNSLWENKSIATVLGYTPADDSLVVKLAGAQTITGVKTFSGQPKFDTAIAIKEGTSGTLTGYTCIGANVNQLLVGVVGATHTLTFPTGSSYTYTLPSATGTLALTSDIPSLTGYVTLATNQTITGDKYFTGFTSFNVNQVVFGGGIAINNTTSGGAASGHTVIGSYADGLQVNLSGGAYNNLKFANTATGHDYTFPNASGTLALTSNLSSYLPLSGGTLTGALGGTSATFSGNVILNGSDSRFNGGDSVGRLILSNSNTTTYIGLYGATHPTLPYVMSFVVNSASALSIASTGAATFSSSVTSSTNFIAQSSTTNSLRFLYENTYNKGGVSIDYTTGELRIYAGESSNGYFQTFHTNGSEKLRISSAGNVGIGTTSPQTLLSVETSGTQSTVSPIITSQSSGTTYTGLYSIRDGAGDQRGLLFQVYTANVGLNEKMRISSTGNVGIGTTTPGVRLVNAGATLAETPTLGSATIGANAILSANGLYGIYTGVSSAGYVWQQVQRNDGNGSVYALALQPSGGNVGIGTTSPSQKLEVNGSIYALGYLVGEMSFTSNQVYRNSANEMYLNYSGTGNTILGNSTGNVLINTTTDAGYKLNVNGNASFGSVYVGSLGTGTVYSSSGTLTNTNPSDKRLKDNITPITYGLNEVLQLNPVSFDWKNDNNKNKQFGFIAQEVQEVMPEAVIEGEYLGLEKDAIYTALVNAIKEQQKQIDELKAKIK